MFFYQAGRINLIIIGKDDAGKENSKLILGKITGMGFFIWR